MKPSKNSFGPKASIGGSSELNATVLTTGLLLVRGNMPDTWFTADFHFGHANIVRYCNRPFATVDEMDQAILERLNASVKINDMLYFLGDFCMGNRARI